MTHSLLWSHPYFDLVRYAPTIPMLRRWAIQAGRIDEAFATILETMTQNPHLPLTFHPPIQENLDDERGHGNPSEEHFTLFQDILSRIGIEAVDYRNTPPLLETEAIITSLMEGAASSDLHRMLGLMASEETICPKEFPVFLEAFCKLTNTEQLTYFHVHIEADERHAHDLIRLCHSLTHTQADAERIFYWQSVDLENNILFYDALLKMECAQ